MQTDSREVYIQVDDTKEMHNNKAGYFTQIANEAFTWFAANDSKSKITFLKTLHVEEVRYIFNEASIEYLKEKNILDMPILILGIVYKSRADYEKYISSLEIKNKTGKR